MTRTRTEITTLTLVRQIVEDLDEYPATPCGAVTTCGAHPAHDASDEPSGIHRRLDGPCTALARAGDMRLAKCGANVIDLASRRKRVA